MKKSHQLRLTKLRGDAGEKLASEFLEARGFSIVARNFRYKRAEVDLIVSSEKLLVFVEVKYRKNHAFGEPESFVSAAQSKRIVEAAEHYVLEHDWHGDIRFDIIAITQATHEIVHLVDAFY